MDVGGIKSIALGVQSDLTIVFNSSDETKIDSIDLANAVVFEHRKNDGSTVFSESKNTSQGLGVVNTDINIRLPRLDNKVNMLDYMSRRTDIVCFMLHNNGSITVSGWMDGLTMNYSANSGSSVADKSYVDVKLEATSWISSLVMDDATALQTPIFG